ncbi:MAG: biotin synthase BioB [Tepidisphaeraceae bacterium]
MHSDSSAAATLSTVDDGLRHDWRIGEVRKLHDLPLMELVFRAAQVHRQHHDPAEVQVCKLISIKTGACPEDCKYCSQSVRYQTEVEPQPLMKVEEVLDIAKRAKEAGVTRVCMGAAWRGAKDNAEFDRVLDMVKEVNALGVETCCTLGLLTENQAQKLDDAGLHAYNHNLDTSETFYGSVISTRKYADRLQTLANVRETDVTVCSGGIIGMGEKVDDRLAMLVTLANFRPHPESVPINVLSRVEGTPFAELPDVPWTDVVRMIAVARILLPKSVVRLSAGRSKMSDAEQAMCFMAGANSFFSSETGHMLTKAVPSPDYDADKTLLAKLGLKIRPPFKDQPEKASACESKPASGSCCGSH